MAEEQKNNYKAVYENRNFMRRETVYCADDHFLIASATGYTERYTRFFFKDIVAFKVRIDKNSNLMLIIYSILTLGALAATMIFGAMEHSVGVVFGIIFLALLTGTLWILSFGPQCKLIFKTLTSEEEFAMGRRSKVMKGLKKLRPYIEKVQGKLEDFESENEVEAEAEEKTYKV